MAGPEREQSDRREPGSGTPGPGPRPAPAVSVGAVTGSAFAIGDHNTVTVASADGGARAPEVDRLSAAVRELRADLSRLTARDAVAVAHLDAELVEVEGEIEVSDTVSRSRLARLRGALVSAAPVVELLASGTAVATAVAALWGS
ncbi:hypothetical protein [Streptomyces sp. NPDC006879]|uniref:hypothetical protein n=1 Tax=Streptomyces sp. NPDC006879 TaxID=3364767 RepID=UPI003677770E